MHTVLLKLVPFVFLNAKDTKGYLRLLEDRKLAKSSEIVDRGIPVMLGNMLKGNKYNNKINTTYQGNKASPSGHTFYPRKVA